MPFLSEIGKLLIFFGLLIIILGLFLMLGGRIPYFGKLPGDIVIHRGNFHFYFPIATCILLSLILTLIFWLIRLLRG